MPTIVHFGIPADNIERAKQFYSDLFGWKIEKMSRSTDENNSKLTSAATGEPIEYWMITTTDDQGNKALGGGLMKRQLPQHQITNYINVSSIDEYKAKIEEAGGKVVALNMQYQEWVILHFVLIQRTILLPYGNPMRAPSNLCH